MDIRIMDLQKETDNSVLSHFEAQQQNIAADKDHHHHHNDLSTLQVSQINQQDKGESTIVDNPFTVQNNEVLNKSPEKEKKSSEVEQQQPPSKQVVQPPPPPPPVELKKVNEDS